MVSAAVPSGEVSLNTSDSKEMLIGYTRDLSETGLSIVISSVPIGARLITDNDSLLLIVLAIPSGTLTLHARTVYSKPVNERNLMEGYIVGAHFLKLTDLDQTRLLQYLDTLESDDFK